MAVNSTSILITSKILIDMDIGLFNVIKDKYNDPTVFDTNILNLDDKLIKGLLQESEYNNPLMIIMKEKDELQADAYYKELMLSEYESIIRNSTSTTIINVIKKFIDSEAGMRIDILCATKLEASIISNFMGNDYHPSSYKFIIQSEREDVDLTVYDTLFIKYANDLLEFANVDGMNIMISDYRCNLDPKKYEEKEKTPKIEYAALYGTHNEFYTFTLYYYDESYYLS